jgi:hypothetical protein
VAEQTPSHERLATGGSSASVGDVVEWASVQLVDGQPTPVRHCGLVYRVTGHLAWVHDPAKQVKFKTWVGHLTVLRSTRRP